jgi:excisionase family DNA binding protein
MFDKITFDQLPEAVSDILDGIAEIKSICEDIRGKKSDKDVYMTIEELCAYHPAHPSHQTVRRWKRLGYIPFYKDEETRRVKFKKSEIDAWIASSRHMSREELNAIEDAKILAQRRQLEFGGLDDDDE